MSSRVVEDRELVTGQNPRSADKFASYFMAKLSRYPEVIPIQAAQPQLKQQQQQQQQPQQSQQQVPAGHHRALSAERAPLFFPTEQR
jgi:hypothetical protein